MSPILVSLVPLVASYTRYRFSWQLGTVVVLVVVVVVTVTVELVVVVVVAVVVVAVAVVTDVEVAVVVVTVGQRPQRIGQFDSNELEVQRALNCGSHPLRSGSPLQSFVVVIVVAVAVVATVVSSVSESVHTPHFTGQSALIIELVQRESGNSSQLPGSGSHPSVPSFVVVTSAVVVASAVVSSATTQSPQRTGHPAAKADSVQSTLKSSRHVFGSGLQDSSVVVICVVVAAAPVVAVESPSHTPHNILQLDTKEVDEQSTLNSARHSNGSEVTPSHESDVVTAVVVVVAAAVVASQVPHPARHRVAIPLSLQAPSCCKRIAQNEASGTPLQKSSHGLIDPVFSMPTSHVAWQRDAYDETASSRTATPSESSFVWQ